MMVVYFYFWSCIQTRFVPTHAFGGSHCFIAFIRHSQQVLQGCNWEFCAHFLGKVVTTRTTLAVRRAGSFYPVY